MRIIMRIIIIMRMRMRISILHGEARTSACPVLLRVLFSGTHFALAASSPAASVVLQLCNDEVRDVSTVTPSVCGGAAPPFF